MSFIKSILCTNCIALLILSMSTAFIESSELAKGVSYFAAEFYEQCAKSKPGNVIVSPLSVATSLALLSQAATGSTFDELRDGLYLNGSDKDTIANQFNDFYSQLQQSVGDSTLSIANQIYIQQGRQINKNFEQLAASKFESGVETLNFGDAEHSAETINHFVEEETHGKIRDFIKPSSLNGNIAVFLVNAIYFKGNWEQKFNEDLTREDDFYINENQTIRTDFMFMKAKFNHAKLADLKASALEMKYANSTLSFVIVLPYSGVGLPELEAKLSDYDLTNITKQMLPRRIDVTIPKFKIDYEIELNAVLKEMGMTKIFTHNAELSGILAGNDAGNSLKVSSVIHKAFIEINEEGSEAAASTAVKIVKKSSPPKFKASHPFFYYIRDAATDTIIFSGRYEKVESK